MTWLADCARLLGLATFMHAAGITCSQRLGDLLASLEPAAEADAVALLGAAPVSIPLPVLEEIIDRSGVAPRIEAAAARRGPRAGSCWSAPCCRACCSPWPTTGPPT